MKTLTKHLLLGLMFVVPNFVKAQQDSTSAVHFGFMYPLSTNGKAAGQVSNYFSLHVLTGYSKSETGFALSGLANIVKEDADGVQIAGLINHIGRNASGVQLAGIGNYVKDTASGLMVSGIYNVSGQAHSQVSGLLNRSQADIRGLQVSGFANQAGDVHSQIGGFINIARRVKGVQLAGFINIADSSDYSIGVINLVKNGEKSLGAYLDETLTTTITFRSGGRKIYSIIGLGYNKRPSGAQYLALEGGLGTNWKLNRNFRLKGEIVSRVLTENFDDDGHQSVSLRLLPSLKIANRFDVFAGPSLNYTYYDREESTFPLPKKYLWTNSRPENFQGIHLGWAAGVQVIF